MVSVSLEKKHGKTSRNLGKTRSIFRREKFGSTFENFEDFRSAPFHQWVLGGYNFAGFCWILPDFDGCKPDFVRKCRFRAVLTSVMPSPALSISDLNHRFTLRSRPMTTGTITASTSSTTAVSMSKIVGTADSGWSGKTGCPAATTFLCHH